MSLRDKYFFIEYNKFDRCIELFFD